MSNSTADLGIVISADSHVIEPMKLWTERLPASMRDVRLPFVGRAEKADNRPGGHNPNERVKEMALDGVSAEVLYPTLALTLFGLDDAALQEACFRVYNDWLIEYCSAAPDRLLGIPCIPAYDIDKGIKELERCAKNGLKGAIIWQSPHKDLPFTSGHYDRFWAAAQEMNAPVSLHILTGHNYSKDMFGGDQYQLFRGATNLKMVENTNALFDIIMSGVLERFPRLTLVNVETEIGWIPFFLQQLDYYWQRFGSKYPLPIKKMPSEYFNRQVWSTFFNDPVGARYLKEWGHDTCMWSNDYPHGNSPWPHSRDVIQRDLAGLPLSLQHKLVRENVVRLYDMKVPETAAVAA